MNLEEGWWMPSRSRKYHYFVEGRALCGGWMFPHYPSLTEDTGNKEPQRDDCKACFRKLVKRRVQTSSQTRQSAPTVKEEAGG